MAMAVVMAAAMAAATEPASLRYHSYSEHPTMTVKPQKKPSAAPGAKLLISVSAIAASLGGWAALAYRQQVQPLATPAAQPTPQSDYSPGAARPAYLNVEFSTIPTLIPVPTLPRPSLTAQPTQPAVVYTAPVATAMPVDPTAGLRVVNAPPPAQNNGGQQAQSGGSGSAPAPVTTTQSSKP